MKYLIENCAGSLSSALRAQLGGADRVELCAALSEGGLTPSWGEVQQARMQLSIRLHVLIRPRSGDFLYNSLEQAVMLEDIKRYAALGVDGFVLGALTAEGTVDTQLMERFIGAAEGRSITFHRAIDMCRDPRAALEEVIALGCGRVLSSGAAASALEGAPLLAQLIDQARGRITIMPGGGITPENIAELARRTGASEYHLSARSPQSSAMRYRNPAVSMGGSGDIDEYAQLLTDPDKLRQARAALATLEEQHETPDAPSLIH